MGWFLVVLFMFICLFSDMMHMLIFSEFKERCGLVDFDTQHDTFSDYCSDSLFRSITRSFATLAGDVGLNDYAELDSYRVIILWMMYILFGVIILLNVLIAVVTESYDRSNSKRHSILGIARIPILARHSYLDTEARKLSQRGYGDSRYRIVLIGIFIFLILYGYSYVSLTMTIINEIEGQISAVVSMEMVIVKLVILSLTYIVSNVAMLVTIKDLFHIDIQWRNFFGTYFVAWIVKPITSFIFVLLGVNNENEYLNEIKEDLAENNILSNVKEMIDISTNRVRADIQKLVIKLK